MRTLHRGDDGVRRVIDGKVWKVLRPIVAKEISGRGAPPMLDVREFLEAVLYINRTGIPWRDLPVCFGAWSAVYMRFRRWQEQGLWERLWRSATLPGSRGKDKLFLDSTVVRAHQHSAGGGGNAEEGKGRSRGGYSTKIHLAATDERTVVAVVVTPGQAGDAPQFHDLLAGLNEEAFAAKEAVADCAYDSDEIRAELDGAGFAATMPSNGSRNEPIPFDRKSYRDRNKVERAVGRLKRMRRVATRFDKLLSVFLAAVHIACLANALT